MTKTLSKETKTISTKAELMDQAVEKMQQHLTLPDWTTLEKMVLAGRILHERGHDTGLAGQVTARISGSNHFVVQKLGVGFDEFTPNALLVVDQDINVVKGSGMPSPAVRFHAGIYDERPDVQCIIHTHSLHASALSMIGKPLEIAHMDSCVLYDDVAFLDSWPGVPVGFEEAELICGALGEKRSILLAHHGMLVTGRTVEEACALAVQFERAAAMQLLAMSAGSMQKITHELGLEAREWLLQEKRVQATFYYYARQILQRFPNCLKD